jgi:anaerobic ribonucleoside-triphosphate reductase activating protein
MNYASIIKADIANGTGFRVSLFVSGCARNCPGCFNKEAQDPAFGKPFDEKAKQKIFKELEYEWCRGLSLLGGEPLSKLSDNRKQVIAFAKEVKEKFPTKDTWIWSGYTLEEIQADDSMKDILKYVDVLVDGPFVDELKDLSLKFRGSSNQRILVKQNGKFTKSE